MTDIQAIAKEARDHFTLDTRNDGTRFWHRKDWPHEDDWIQSLIYSAHGDFLPDDFRYETIVDALDAFSDTDDPEERISELEPATYNASRVAWLASDLRRGGYCDEVLEEYGDQDSIYAVIGLGMLGEMREVYDAVLASLVEELEERGDNEADEEPKE